MKILGRFATRDDHDENHPVLVLGAVMASELIKPGHVYQLEEILGEIVVRDMGLSSINMDERKRMEDAGKVYPWINWNHSVNSILSGGDGAHLMTAEEYSKFDG